MKKLNFVSLLAISAGIILFGAGCGSTPAPQPNNPAPITVNPEESDVINTLPQSEAAPKQSSSQPVPEATPQPTSVVPSKTTPAPTPSPAPQPQPTPAPQPTLAPTPAPKRVSAIISGFAFQASSITINAGDTVTWTNQDSVVHTVTADDGSFDSGSIAPGASYSHTFSTVGTAAYHCTPHPYMHGSVTVH